jgi:uncharacterized membrane protein
MRNVSGNNSMDTSSQFVQAWEDYKRRVRWFFGGWLGGFAVVALLAALLNRLSLGEVALSLLGPTWIVLIIVVAVRVQLFKCPRCHRQFFKAFWYYSPFARRCVHCGLPKWGCTDSCETPIR